MKAFILTRDHTECSACEDDALAYVDGDGIITIERNGKVMKLCGSREARLVAYRLCRTAEFSEEIDERDRERRTQRTPTPKPHADVAASRNKCTHCDAYVERLEAWREPTHEERTRYAYPLGQVLKVAKAACRCGHIGLAVDWSIAPGGPTTPGDTPRSSP